MSQSSPRESATSSSEWSKEYYLLDPLARAALGALALRGTQHWPYSKGGEAGRVAVVFVDSPDGLTSYCITNNDRLPGLSSLGITLLDKPHHLAGELTYPYPPAVKPEWLGGIDLSHEMNEKDERYWGATGGTGWAVRQTSQLTPDELARHAQAIAGGSPNQEMTDIAANVLRGSSLYPSSPSAAQ